MKAVLFVSIAMLSAGWLLLSGDSITAGQKTQPSLKELPGFYSGGDRYKVDPYIAAAAKFQAIGKEKTFEALKKDGGFDSTIVLARMLFTAKPKKEFRRPMIGEASFLGGSSYEDWPLEPIEIVDGIPFLVVVGYSLSGRPEVSYLDYCIKECDWGAAEFKPRSMGEKKKALAKLLASPKWKKQLTADEKAFLSAQIK